MVRGVDVGGDETISIVEQWGIVSAIGKWRDEDTAALAVVS
jgi:hypothetical protein